LHVLLSIFDFCLVDLFSKVTPGAAVTFLSGSCGRHLDQFSDEKVNCYSHKTWQYTFIKHRFLDFTNHEGVTGSAIGNVKPSDAATNRRLQPCMTSGYDGLASIARYMLQQSLL